MLQLQATDRSVSQQGQIPALISCSISQTEQVKQKTKISIGPLWVFLGEQQLHEILQRLPREDVAV